MEALEKFRRQAKISAKAKLTYAGRLDPMASGVLLILEGASQAQKEKFLALDKKYKAKILFGFSTDSYDLLGMPKTGKPMVISRVQILRSLDYYKGKVKLPIPGFSSVQHKGSSLFVLTRQGKILEKDLPNRLMDIKSLKLLSTGQISATALNKKIELGIKKVTGDFRQEKILKAWNKILKGRKEKYQSIELLISCGSGTYIRSIANNIGKRLGMESVLLNLERLSVGKYNLKNTIK